VIIATSLGLRVLGLSLIGLAMACTSLAVPNAEPGAPPASQSQASPSEPGSPAPDFTLAVYGGDGFTEGQTLRLSEVLQRGQPMVLNFWAGQCPPCRAEMPDFQRVYDQRKAEFLMLGVDVGPFVGLGNESDARRLLRDLSIRYPTATTAEARIIQEYRVLGMPTTVFIGRDGKIASRVIGVLNAQRLEQQIDALLK